MFELQIVEIYSWSAWISICWNLFLLCIVVIYFGIFGQKRNAPIGPGKNMTPTCPLRGGGAQNFGPPRDQPQTKPNFHPKARGETRAPTKSWICEFQFYWNFLSQEKMVRQKNLQSWLPKPLSRRGGHGPPCPKKGANHQSKLGVNIFKKTNMKSFEEVKTPRKWWPRGEYHQKPQNAIFSSFV